MDLRRLHRKENLIRDYVDFNHDVCGINQNACCARRDVPVRAGRADSQGSDKTVRVQ
jgi:hypothetical protein